MEAVSPPFAPLRKSNMGGGGVDVEKRLFTVLRFMVFFAMASLLLTTKAC